MNIHEYMELSKSGVELQVFATISTCHVCQESMEALTSQARDVPGCLTWEHGVLMYVDESDMADCFEDINQILRWGRAIGIHWIRLDADGPTCEELNTYDW